MNQALSITSLILCFFLIGCTPMKKITFLNESNNIENQKDWEVSPIPPKHRLEIGNILMIKVISRNEESNKLFNIESNTNSSNPNLTSANLYLNGFTISQNGTIDIPNVGEVYIVNQTLEEAEKTIFKKASELLIDPYVVVKLANFQFTMLGEVNVPGKYPVYNEGITIFDAIAMSGGINDYGNLKNIKIVRSENNKKKIYDIDLTSSDIINSDFYYLRNNDLVYVKPLKFKSFRKSQSQLLLSSLTTVAVLLNVYLRFTE